MISDIRLTSNFNLIGAARAETSSVAGWAHLKREMTRFADIICKGNISMQ
jgi:hypothetical protein